MTSVDYEAVVDLVPSKVYIGVKTVNCRKSTEECRKHITHIMNQFRNLGVFVITIHIYRRRLMRFATMDRYGCDALNKEVS